MEKISCGSASVVYEIGNDGLLRACWKGLVLQNNAGEISARLLEVADAAGAAGVIGRMTDSVVGLPPVTSQHYAYVPTDLRAIPVALLISPEQNWVYSEVATEAALSGTMRRAFLSLEQGEVWAECQVRAQRANQAWWSTRRSQP